MFEYYDISALTNANATQFNLREKSYASLKIITLSRSTNMILTQSNLKTWFECNLCQK